MRPMERVEKIKADIEALPKEYRLLVQVEQAWAAKHPVIYASALVGLGGAIMAIAFLVFGS